MNTKKILAWAIPTICLLTTVTTIGVVLLLTKNIGLSCYDPYGIND